MPDILVLCPTTERMQARLADAFDPAYAKSITDFPNWIVEHGSKIRYVLTDGHLGVPKPVFDALPNLSLISSYGVGYDAIDTAAATSRGIPVCHTPDVLSDEVATTAVMLYLACWRNLEAEMANARTGAWAERGALPLARTADGRRVGILGLGRIGKAIARKLAPFSPELHYCGRTKQPVPFTYHASLLDMAAVCDTLICVVPGGRGTHHLINAEVLEALGPDGFLINVGRGSTVDETALISALKNRRLGGAGLDVFESEPHIPAELRALSNVILTPHIGSATIETRAAMGDLAIDNLVACKNGEALLSPVPESACLLKGP